MTYLAPSLNDLKKGISLVIKQYENDNSERKEFIKLFKLIKDLFEKDQQTTYQITDEQLKSFIIAAYLFALESIDNQYSVIGPDYTPRLFGLFHTGSTLFTSILKQLNIQNLNEIDNETKLKYLNDFYNYFISPNRTDKKIISLIDQSFEMHKLKMTSIKPLLKIVYEKILRSFEPTINQIINAIPTEKVVDYQASNLYCEYKPHIQLNTKGIKQHIFLVQLSDAIFDILKSKKKSDSGKEIDSEEKNDPSIMPRSQQIELGILTLIVHHLEQDHIYDPHLSNICQRLFTKINLDKLTPKEQINAMAATQTFLYSDKNIQHIEAYGRKNYEPEDNFLQNIDWELKKLRKKISEINTKLEKEHTNQWTLAYLLKKMGELVLAAPGYGIGAVAGVLWSNTNAVEPTKHAISKKCETTINNLINFPVGSFAYSLVSFSGDTIFGRAAGKLLEACFILTGGTLGFLAGALLDGTLNGLQNFYSYYKDINPHEYNLITNFIRQAIIILKSPDEFVPEDIKKKILGLLGVNPNININDFVKIDEEITLTPRLGKI